MVLLITLDLNSLALNSTSAELTEIILSLASGNCSYEKLLEWVRNRIA